MDFGRAQGPAANCPARGSPGADLAGSFRRERAGEQRQREGDSGAEIRRRSRRNLVQGAQRQPAAEHAVERGDAEGKPPACGPPYALRLDRRHAAPEREYRLVRMVGHGHALDCSCFVLKIPEHTGRVKSGLMAVVSQFEILRS